MTSTLHILSGVHEGASTPVREGIPYRIGADMSGDIVLRDKDVAAHQVTIELRGKHIRLASHADQVWVNDRLAIPPGLGCEQRLPCEFAVGSVRLSIVMNRSADGRAASENRLARRMLVPALAALVASCVYFLLPSSGKTESAMPDASLPSIQASKALPARENIRTRLIEQLQEAGLGGLDVRLEGSLVTVQGVVSDGQKARWHDIQEWFDQHYGSNHMLRAELEKAVAPRLTVTAVWLGDSPYIVDDKGVRRYPGAILEEGWMLKSISRQSIVLIRKGREHVFRL